MHPVAVMGQPVTVRLAGTENVPVRVTDHTLAVRVTDVDISFGSAVTLLVKFALASVPALILLLGLTSAVVAFFGLLGLSLG